MSEQTETPDRERFRWHYGPTATDPEPGKMWHYDCGGEVMFIEDGYVCMKCELQGEDDDDGYTWVVNAPGAGSESNRGER